MSDVLTVGGFVAIATLVIAILALAISAFSRGTAISERLAKLEARFESHVHNGDRHGNLSGGS